MTRTAGIRMIHMHCFQPRETVRKVSEALPAQPDGLPKRGSSGHFVLRIGTKSSLGPLLVPFSDSLRRIILGNPDSYTRIPIRYRGVYMLVHWATKKSS